MYQFGIDADDGRAADAWERRGAFEDWFGYVNLIAKSGLGQRDPATV